MGLKKAEYGEEGCWSLGKGGEHCLMVRICGDDEDDVGEDKDDD